MGQIWQTLVWFRFLFQNFHILIFLETLIWTMLREVVPSPVRISIISCASTFSQHQLFNRYLVLSPWHPSPLSISALLSRSFDHRPLIWRGSFVRFRDETPAIACEVKYNDQTISFWAYRSRHWETSLQWLEKRVSVSFVWKLIKMSLMNKFIDSAPKRSAEIMKNDCYHITSTINHL
jgi:hypothetical protein